MVHQQFLMLFKPQYQFPSSVKHKMRSLTLWKRSIQLIRTVIRSCSFRLEWYTG